MLFHQLALFRCFPSVRVVVLQTKLRTYTLSTETSPSNKTLYCIVITVENARTHWAITNLRYQFFTLASLFFLGIFETVKAQ